jgi:hypothetical protein
MFGWSLLILAEAALATIFVTLTDGRAGAVSSLRRMGKGLDA